jgi:hypothetical protein
MKKSTALFIVCFLIIISLPLILIDRKSTVSEKENRTLASFPQFSQDGQIININTLPRAFDNYINDRFGFRNTAVSFVSRLNGSAKIINGNVVFGKKDWLFYSNPDDPVANNIIDFFKINLFTEAEIQNIIINLENRLAWCNENGIKFIFLIAPNKHSIYPEYYPVDRPMGITRTEQIINALPQNLQNTVVYPLNYLLQNKNNSYPLYFETDTHWNMAGAKCAFDLLFSTIKNDFPATIFPEIDYTINVSYDSFGDIAPMSGFSSYGKRTIPNIQPINGWELYYHYIKNEGRQGSITENTNKVLPKAIVFCDSFFSILEPFTSSIFSKAEYNWRWFNASEKEYILKYMPDIVIWEVVERNIGGIPAANWQ